MCKLICFLETERKIAFYQSMSVETDPSSPINHSSNTTKSRQTRRCLWNHRYNELTEKRHISNTLLEISMNQILLGTNISGILFHGNIMTNQCTLCKLILSNFSNIFNPYKNVKEYLTRLYTAPFSLPLKKYRNRISISSSLRNMV